MSIKPSKRPSPALVVATVALFIALGGTAGAVVNAAVPLAKRALVADNAKKVSGQTAQQITQAASQQAGQVPGPASSAAGIISIKSQSIGQLGPNQGRPVPISCDSGAKVLGGGFSSDGPVYNFDSYPSADGTWTLYLINPDDAAGHSVTVYATCVK